jgi:glycosyltransferase involved in cell wall biosynthesis
MTGSSTNKPQLSIIVPVLNEITGIELFVAHLKSQWRNPQELIFVDGGSTDGTWEWLQKNHFKRCKAPQEEPFR